jgi:hypothetical protein
MIWLSYVLAAIPIAVVVGGIWNRTRLGKGIGWQFIRFTVVSVSLPLVAILALNDALTGEASTIIAAAMAYAFGKSGEKPGDDG